MFNLKKPQAVFSILLSVSVLQSAIFAIVPDGVAPKDPPKFERWTVVGPNGGDVRSVAIDPRDENRLYISTLDGQIHTSADAGKTWRLLVNLNQPELVIDNLMVDSRDSKLIYASGHRHKNPGGFFRSTDAGATWKESKELRKESVHALTQSPSDPNILLAGTVNGVWVSKNSGADWERYSSPSNPININSIAVDPRNPNTIYAGTWWRPYKTTDNGKNWRLIKTGMIDDSDVFAMEVNPRNPDHVISSACSGIYESFNGGEKWTKIQGIPSQSRRTRDIMQHPTVPSTYYAATTEGFWMSVNSGKSWALTTQRNLEINSIAVHPSVPNRVFIGTNNYGVMVSNDSGRNFVPTNDSFTSRFAYSVLPDSQQSNRLYAATRNIATGGGFVFVSNDSGVTWTPSRSLDINRVSPFAIVQDRKNANLMYLGTNLGIYRSLDRGVSWLPLPTVKPPVAPKKPVKRAVPARKGTASVKAPVVTAAAAGPTIKMVPSINEKVKVLSFTEDGRNGLFAGTDKGLYRSYDIAKGWEKLNLGIGVNDNIFVVHMSPTRPGTIWVGTATSGVLVSKDDGKTWTKAGGAVDGVPISSIATDPERPDFVYVGTTQTFYVSKDGGASWKRRGGDLPLGNFTSILINPNNTDEIIVSSAIDSDGGIFISTDSGNRWKRIDGKDWKLPSRRVWSLAFDPTDPNRLFAGTHSSGVYKIERRADTAAAPATDQTVGNGNPE